MRIKTLFFAGSLGFLLFSVCIGGAFYFAERRFKFIEMQSVQASSLVGEAFELNALGQEFAKYFDDRPKEQWYLRHERLVEALDSPYLSDSAIRTSVEQLKADVRTMKVNFDQLVAASLVAAPDSPVVKQLTGDLLVTMRRGISHVDAIVDAAVRQRDVTSRQIGLLILIVLIGVAIAANIALITLLKKIMNPIVKLQKGVEIVGKGDLTYRVGSGEKDEIGQLSAAFDDMSLKLKRSYDELEEKVRLRTQELHELSKKNETLLKSIGDGVVAIDTNWNIIMWNPAATRITGWSEDEVLGKPFRSVVKFIRERDRHENVLFISDAMLSAKTQFMENHTLLIRKDGSEIPVGDSASPILSEEKHVLGAIIVFRDATSEREAEQIRSSFAYASHQLRTPVTEALWNIELAREEAKLAGVQQKLAIAHNSMKSVKKLVNELVLVSEIDQRTLMPVFADVLLSEVLDEVVTLNTEMAKERQVDIHLIPMSAPIIVKTDVALLTKALNELVHNAVVYSRAHGSVSISAHLQDGNAVVEISDSGLGIPESQQSLIFTKFFRGQNLSKESVGAGLGLYIAREYSKLLKGQLWFRSVENKGTSFFLAVPAVA